MSGVDALLAEFLPNARPAVEEVLARRGHAALAEMRRQGVPPGVASATGITPLYLAAAGGDLETARLLLDAGAPVDGAPGRAPLHTAVDLRDPTMLRLLLEAGARPDGRLDDEPALHHAALLGHRQGGELLLAFGASIEAQNSVGDTAIVVAASAGNWQFVEWLWQQGANPMQASRGGITMPLLAYRSRLSPATADGAARNRVIQQLQGQGVPWPPPSAAITRERLERGDWPPR